MEGEHNEGQAGNRCIGECYGAVVDMPSYKSVGLGLTSGPESLCSVHPAVHSSFVLDNK